MNSKLLLYLALVLSFGWPGWVDWAHGADQIFQDTNDGFRFNVPAGWTATATNFEVFHYNGVAVTVNSWRPGLAIRMQSVGPGEFEFGPKIVRQQMLPGEVYLTIGFFDGPGGPMMGPDSVANDLLPLLATNSLTTSAEPGLSELDLSFFKRGHWLNISAYARDPVTESDRRKVMGLLASFRFLDAPVANVAWAESLAWQKLPEKVRAIRRCPVLSYSGQQPSGSPTVRVDQVDAGYAVKFAVDGVGSWEYLVSTDGKIQPGSKNP